MKKTGLVRTVLLMLAVAGASLSVSAQLAENSRVQLIRATVGTAGRAENTRVVVTGTAEFSPSRSVGAEGTRATVYAGALAPATDVAGLITVGRLQAVLLGSAAVLEPVALDFAGNRDGVVDVADLVTLVQKLVN